MRTIAVDLARDVFQLAIAEPKRREKPLTSVSQQVNMTVIESREDFLADDFVKLVKIRDAVEEPVHRPEI